MNQETPISIRDAIRQLQDLGGSNMETLQFLEELGDNLENPDYTPPTFGEMFGTEDGAIVVFGEVLPDDIEGLAQTPVDFELLKAPVKRVLTHRRRIAQANEMMTRSVVDFRKRARRAALRAMRAEKGGTQRARRFTQTRGVKFLDLFAVGEPKNSLTFSKKGTYLTVGTSLPEGHVNLRNELSTLGPDPALEDLQPLLHEQLRQLAGTALDHRDSLSLVVSTPMGHDRIERSLTLGLLLTVDNGLPGQPRFYRATLSDNNGKITIRDAAEVTYPTGTVATADQALVTGTLQYTMRSSRNKLDEVINALELVSELPLYRGLAGYTLSGELDDISDDALESLLDDDLLDDEPLGDVGESLQQDVQADLEELDRLEAELLGSGVTLPAQNAAESVAEGFEARHDAAEEDEEDEVELVTDDDAREILDETVPADEFVTADDVVTSDEAEADDAFTFAF